MEGIFQGKNEQVAAIRVEGKAELKMRAGSLCIGFVTLVSAMAALPPGVTIKQLPDDVILYERPRSEQSLPAFWAGFFDLFRVHHDTGTKLPFERSIALLIGVGNYRYITPALEYIYKDVEKMRDYLLAEGGFDQVYVLDERSTPQMVESYMMDKLPTALGKHDRLLFYYSGHSADSGGGHPFLQFQDARIGQFSRSVLPVNEFDAWSDRIPSDHILFIYDTCLAGLAVAKAGQTEAGSSIAELSSNGSRIVVTAGTADQKSWVATAERPYSIFTDILIKSLRDGGADGRNRGFVTIEQAVAETQIQLATITRQLGPGHEMKPVPTPIKSKFRGTFVFLNPKAVRPSIPPADVNYMGVTVAKEGNPDAAIELEFAHWRSIEPLHELGQYALHCDLFPHGVFCPVARRRLAEAYGQRPAAPTGLVVLVDGRTEPLGRYSVDQLRALAKNRYAGAAYQTGRAYELGLKGAREDLPAAMFYYSMGADQEDGLSAQRLATIYFFGRKGVAADPAEAVDWYQRAVNQGNPSAMFDLGTLYSSGKAGLRKDETQAAKLYLQAANAGNSDGMAAFAGMCLRGAGGMARDEGKALAWYQKASGLGNAPGMVALGAMYERGQGGLRPDDRKALELYQRAAAMDDPKGLAYLGRMWEQGKGGLNKDAHKALDLYSQAAAQEGEDGLAFLASMYEDGKGGLTRDLKVASSLYRRAEQMGSEYAEQRLRSLQARILVIP
ncbi:MAG: caspase family protein [Candidatus Acidiferrales bacterium]